MANGLSPEPSCGFLNLGESLCIWVKMTNNNGTLTGSYNSDSLATDYLCNPFGVLLGVTYYTPGCAARPWAKSCNAYGVRTLAANPTISEPQQTRSPHLRGL